MKPAVAVMVLCLWSVSARVLAVNAKSSANFSIADDSITGSAGRSNRKGGAYTLSGTLGGLGTTRFAATAALRDAVKSPAPAAADLSQARVYPVPFKPNGGDPDYGAPFSAGNPNSGIIFDNLPRAATIKIYTISGRLVTSFDSNAPTGRIQWDARNGSGRDVATGYYLAVITSPGMPALTKKLLIIR
jgi:hypothetical protein